MRMSVDGLQIEFKVRSWRTGTPSLFSLLQRQGYAVLDDDQDEEQQALVNDEKKTVNTAEYPNGSLHQADPDKVVQLVPANRT